MAETATVRMLCARGDTGELIFGPIAQSHDDVLTKGTQSQIDGRNAAWDAATKNGELCGKLGTAPFGGIKWGTQS